MSLSRQAFSSLGIVKPAAALVLVAGLTSVATLSRAETSHRLPAPSLDEAASASGSTETAVFAGGCFWGVQGVFQHVKGVTQAVSGYSGGAKDTAIYEIVGSGRTGHAESVEISYDPAQITYGKLLQIFFSVAHDPTQVGGQGPDMGSQYRSAVFTHDESQAKIVKAYIDQVEATGVLEQPIATEVAPLKAFYTAEAYHQDYATLHPDSAYIAYHDLPKIAQLARLFPEVYREAPVLVSAVTQ